MDHFNEIQYLYYLCLLGLKNKIIDCFENKFINLRFSKEKISNLEKQIVNFCSKKAVKELNINKVVDEFYSILKPIGVKIERFLEEN